MYLTNLADIARNAGLKVVEQPGWKTRGHGQMTAVRTILCHHTAGSANGNSPSLGVVQNGRAGLAGPLSHFVLGRDGTVFVVAAGLCWHAGVVKNSDQDNYHAIGIEAEATGLASWPEVQMVAYAKLCKALCKAFGLSTSRVLGHKEACSPTGRKIDPNFDMNAFRARVASVGINPEDDDMTPQEFRDTQVIWWDGKSMKVNDILAELHIVASAMLGAAPFAGQTTAQLPPITGPQGLKLNVDRIDDIEVKVSANTQALGRIEALLNELKNK